MNASSPDIAREQMIYHQVRPWDVTDKRILTTLGAVPRENFLPERYRGLAFSDSEIPLPAGQNMLKPILEGRLLQALAPAVDHSALVIGTGSGYVAACVAALADHVMSLDIHPELTDTAAGKLVDANIRNIELVTADMNAWSPAGSWDRILVTGSMPLFDSRLPEWLNEGGRLIMIVGSAPAMCVEEVVRVGQRYTRKRLFETVVRSLENVPQPPSFQL